MCQCVVMGFRGRKLPAAHFSMHLDGPRQTDSHAHQAAPSLLLCQLAGCQALASRCLQTQSAMQTTSKELQQAELSDTYAFKYMAPQETIMDLPNPFQSALVVHPPPTSPVPPPAQPHSCMDNQSEAEPERLVHAAIIDVGAIQMCRRENGEDWQLGMGSYGEVSPISALEPLVCLCPCPSPTLSSPLKLP